MKIIVAVIVYDRLSNLIEWIRCWKLCDKEEGTELVVIHNYKSHAEKEVFFSYCQKEGIKCFSRHNTGMDIGAFQDVCYGRIEEFPEWEYLLWCTDDVLPMTKSFLSPYINKIKNSPNSVVCLELSHEVKPHIRTTGFIIGRETARKLTFPADPISTREECFQFEHRSKNAFLEQIHSFGGQVIQVYSDVEHSYMWDTHNRARFNREKERLKAFE